MPPLSERSASPSLNRRLRCPHCRAEMELSDTPVMLPDEIEAEAPVWLCRDCWHVEPIEGEQLHLVRLDSSQGR